MINLMVNYSMMIIDIYFCNKKVFKDSVIKTEFYPWCQYNAVLVNLEIEVYTIIFLMISIYLILQCMILSLYSIGYSNLAFFLYGITNKN